MPVLSVVIPRLKTNQLRWTFSGAFEVMFISLPSSEIYTIKIYRQKKKRERLLSFSFVSGGCWLGLGCSSYSLLSKN